ncbi:MAG TPA: PadR family transcriptional regulator [Bryobacteraceae bacterium]|nr:PadR family transcriptional regulator [Bryobacteraceae bacterium]
MTWRSERDSIPQGTLDMLILTTLAARKEMHGFEIADSILEQSESVLQVEEGSLYPALQRLLAEGWITGEWGRTEGNRRARYYRLTSTGKKQLARERAKYERVSRAIGRILQLT